jgi:hypothetical protein
MIHICWFCLWHWLHPNLDSWFWLKSYLLFEEYCHLPMERGNCRALIPAWYYDHLTGLCNEFQYGGCGGNDNRFTSREVCESSCSSDSKFLSHKQVCKSSFSSVVKSYVWKYASRPAVVTVSYWITSQQVCKSICCSDSKLLKHKSASMQVVLQ